LGQTFGPQPSAPRDPGARLTKPEPPPVECWSGAVPAFVPCAPVPDDCWTFPAGKAADRDHCWSLAPAAGSWACERGAAVKPVRVGASATAEDNTRDRTAALTIARPTRPIRGNGRAITISSAYPSPRRMARRSGRVVHALKGAAAQPIEAVRNDDSNSLRAAVYRPVRRFIAGVAVPRRSPPGVLAAVDATVLWHLVTTLDRARGTSLGLRHTGWWRAAADLTDPSPDAYCV
jgi:hypothetical protein